MHSPETHKSQGWITPSPGAPELNLVSSCAEAGLDVCKSPFVASQGARWLELGLEIETRLKCKDSRQRVQAVSEPLHIMPGPVITLSARISFT